MIAARTKRGRLVAIALVLWVFAARDAHADVSSDGGTRSGDLHARASSDARARDRERDAGVIAAPAERSEPVAAIPGLRRDGSWPDDDDERVTLALEGVPRDQAIRKLADAAGWSVVVRGVGDARVDVRVKKQPAARVLALILAGAEPFVAQRDGDMIAIAPLTDTAPIASSLKPEKPRLEPPPPPPPPPSPPPSSRQGEDRLVTAGNMTVRADEVVANLTVLAGNVDVYGTVTGDLAVFAGNVRVRAGAHVGGDVSAVAGHIEIDEGATVDGDVSGVVGDVHRRSHDDDDEEDEDQDQADDDDDRHDIAAAVRSAQRAARRHGHLGDGDDEDEDDEDEEAEPTVLMRLERAGNAVARSALLFAFGAVLMAVAGARMQRLQTEVTERPFHALVVGAVSLTGAILAAIVTMVTIVGIPLALALVLTSAVAIYVGMCAALTAVGRALLHARSPSVYLYLAVGCGLYLLCSSLPVVGWLFTMVTAMIGFGAIVRTRAAGLFSPRSRPPPAAEESLELGPEG